MFSRVNPVCIWLRYHTTRPSPDQMGTRKITFTKSKSSWEQKLACHLETISNGISQKVDWGLRMSFFSETKYIHISNVDVGVDVDAAWADVAKWWAGRGPSWCRQNQQLPVGRMAPNLHTLTCWFPLWVFIYSLHKFDFPLYFFYSILYFFDFPL